MSKLSMLNIVFIVIEIIAFIPLTIEVFGDMDPDIITISAVIFGVGMIGACICSFIRAVSKIKKK